MDQWHAFGATLAIEMLVVVACAYRRQALPRILLAVLLVNAVTHPLAWKMAMLLTPAAYRTGLWVLEAAVVLAEAVWYGCWFRMRAGTALLLSLGANLASLGIGWWLW